MLDWIKRTFGPRIEYTTPYRRVISREPIEAGREVVHLECGHTVELIHHQRVVIPCEQCRPKET